MNNKQKFKQCCKEGGMSVELIMQGDKLGVYAVACEYTGARDFRANLKYESVAFAERSVMTDLGEITVFLAV